ncbi:hypothetical protein RSAG8_06387, partial [Rhizoctonia solani AG-8 WAC10335]
MVHEPLFRGQKASELVLAVDHAHIAHRARTGKSQFACVESAPPIIDTGTYTVRGDAGPTKA